MSEHVPRVAIVASHPIQYQAPWFRALARVTDLTVFFCHRQDSAAQADAGFGVPFEWDVPLLEGYEHRWLENRSSRPGVSTFSGCDTPEIASVIQAGRFDACIVSGWYLKSYLQAIRACRRAHVPVFVRGDSQLNTPRSRLVRAAKYLPYRFLVRHVDGHLFVGRANREYLLHYGADERRLFFAPHFVDNARFRRQAAEARADGTVAAVRRQAGADRETTLIACAAKAIAVKRPGDYIRALARARANGANVRGLFIGDGPLAASIAALGRELNVPLHMAGFRNQSEMPRFLAACDALVLPSASETWGLVVNEAMACGLPAIVSRGVGCAPDLIDEGVTGFTFDVGDVAGLAGSIAEVQLRLQHNPDAFRAAVGATVDNYTVDAAVHGALQAIGAALHERAAGRAA